jgi:hypothetical protein
MLNEVVNTIMLEACVARDHNVFLTSDVLLGCLHEHGPLFFCSCLSFLLFLQ